MKKTLLLFVVMVIFQSLIGEGYAQSCLPATPVTTALVTTRLQEGSRVTDVIHEVVITRTDKGQIVHKINVETIRFIGGSATLADEISTAALFDALSYSTAQQVGTMGYPSCPVSCTAPAEVRVEVPACVTRIRLGLDSRITSCTTQECSWRTYSLCCQSEGSMPDVSLRNWSVRVQCPDSSCENSCH